MNNIKFSIFKFNLSKFLIILNYDQSNFHRIKFYNVIMNKFRKLKMAKNVAVKKGSLFFYLISVIKILKLYNRYKTTLIPLKLRL